MDNSGRQYDFKFDSATLFNKRHIDLWEMELWVLPQSEGPQKLFRYQHGRLTQFLSRSPKVRRIDKRQYVEAHIVPKLQNQSYRGATLVNQ